MCLNVLDARARSRANISKKKLGELHANACSITRRRERGKDAGKVFRKRVRFVGIEKALTKGEKRAIIGLKVYTKI